MYVIYLFQQDTNEEEEANDKEEVEEDNKSTTKEHELVSLKSQVTTRLDK